MNPGNVNTVSLSSNSNLGLTNASVIQSLQSSVVVSSVTQLTESTSTSVICAPSTFAVREQSSSYLNPVISTFNVPTSSSQPKCVSSGSAASAVAWYIFMRFLYLFNLKKKRIMSGVRDLIIMG